MNPYVEIIRPGNVIMAIIAVILVAILAKSVDIPIILAMLAVFFAMSAGNVINDYFDYKIDLINKPQRPIPSGRISRQCKKLCISFIYSCGNCWVFNILFGRHMDSLHNSNLFRHYTLPLCI